MTVTNMKGSSKLTLNTPMNDGKARKQRQNQSIEEAKGNGKKEGMKESPQMEILDSDQRSVLPVFTTQKMMDKSESLLNPSNTRQS